MSKKNENSKIRPILRGVFAPLFCYSIFKRITQQAKLSKYKILVNPKLLAIIFIIWVFLGNLISRYYSHYVHPKYNIFGIIISLTAFMPLIPLQEMVNLMHIDKSYNNLENRLTWKGRTLFVFSSLYFLLASIGLITTH